MDAQMLSWLFRHRISPHARIVAPSAPLRKHPRELFKWAKYVGGKPKHGKIQSWTVWGQDYVKTVSEQAKRIRGIIEKEAKVLNGDYKKIYLVGYSQGADLANQIGVSFDKQLGGIISLMNFSKAPVLGRNDANLKTPIFVVLGAKDPLIHFKPTMG